MARLGVEKFNMNNVTELPGTIHLMTGERMTAAPLVLPGKRCRITVLCQSKTCL